MHSACVRKCVRPLNWFLLLLPFSLYAPPRPQCTAVTAGLITAQLAAGAGAGEGVRLERRGETAVKGKGDMETYWVLPNDPP